MQENNVVPMTDGEYGIIETEEAVIGAGEFTSKLDKALSDGKYDFIDDTLLIAPALPKLIAGIKGGHKIPKEIKDLSPAEREQLNAAIAKHFQMTTERAERVAEAAFRWLIATTDLVFEING